MLQRVVSNRFEYAVCPAGDSDFTRGNDGISTPGEQAQTLRIGKKSLLHGSEENGSLNGYEIRTLKFWKN